MSTKSLSALALALSLGTGGVAAAQDTPQTVVQGDSATGPTYAPLETPVSVLPQNYVARPLTLPGRTLRVDAAPSDFGLMDSGEVLGPLSVYGSYGLRPGAIRFSYEDPVDGTQVTDSERFTQVGFGASYGVNDAVEVGMLLLPVHSDDTKKFGNITLYGRFALVSGDFSLAFQATAGLPTYNDFSLAAGLPMNIRVGDSIRIETGVEGEFILDVEDDSTTYINLDVPLAVSVGIGNGFVGGRTGVTFYDLQYFGVANVPVGVQGGYSHQFTRSLLDVKASFVWNITIDDIPDESEGYWYLMLGANAHFQL